MLSTKTALPLMAAVLIAFLLVFLSKPVHIDDTVFLKTAEFLTKHPSKPFSAEINWAGTSRSLFYEDNPFFLCYFFALVLKTLGNSEAALHASCIIFPLIALFSCYGIAKRTQADPVLGTALLISSPAFLVSSTTLMGDVPLIAFYLLSCYFYLRFCENEEPVDGWLFAISICIAGFTKYIGLTLIPLILIDSIPRGLLRKITLYLLLPFFLFLLWCLQNYLTFGAIHILEAGKSMNFEPKEIGKKIIACFSFTGLAVLGFTMFANLKRVSNVLLWLLLAVLSGILVQHFQWTHSLWNTALMSLGMSAAFASFLQIYRSPRDRFLLIWFSGMLLYSWLAEFVAARVVLLLATPLFLLLSKRLPEKIILPSILLNLALSVYIAIEDTNLATLYKSFAESTPVQHTHYIAHWGFQYYMEQQGVTPFEYEKDQLQKGDLLVVPKVAGTSIYTIPTQEGRFLNATIQLENKTQFDIHRGLFLMNTDQDAGFYCHGWGMLPFSFGHGPSETVSFFRVSQIIGEDKEK